MAKGDSNTTAPKAPTAPQASQMPQQNQYLEGNPSTDSEANTRWMNPSEASSTTGINGGGGAQQAQGVPLQNGTMLGQITAGQVGQYMPGGYDQAKFNDPTLGTSTKYQVGRILSQYPPGPEGLRAASQQLAALGISIIGKDTIRLPDGTTVDVGRSFSDPNAQHNWQYNWSGPLGQSGQPQQAMMGNSMLGQNPMNQNQFLQQMFQQMMAQRQQYANQQFNPTGGQVPQVQAPVGVSGTPYGGGVGDQSMMQPLPGYTNPSMLGFNYDPRRIDENGIRIS